MAGALGQEARGANRVDRILEGKTIQEDFTAPGLHDLSFSSYDPERNVWCQTWVDNNGTYVDFTGSFQEGRMILIRDAVVRGKACKQRVIGYDIQDDQFRWIRERSDDGGQTWRVLWKTHYTRKKSELS